MLFHIGGDIWADTDELDQETYYYFCQVRYEHTEAFAKYKLNPTNENLERMNRLANLMRNIAVGKITDVKNNPTYKELMLG